METFLSRRVPYLRASRKRRAQTPHAQAVVRFGFSLAGKVSPPVGTVFQKKDDGIFLRYHTALWNTGGD